MNKKYLSINLNSFKIPEWDPTFEAPNIPENPTHESLLKHLSSIEASSDMHALRSRYNDISKADCDLILTIEEPEIKENMVGPLRQAKMNYILGNYVSSVVLCSIVGEKVALFIHKINKTDSPRWKEFDRNMKQSERLNSLKDLGLVDEQVEEAFRYLNKVRRSYLHHWDTLESDTAEKAMKSYATATLLILATMNIGIKGGKAILEDNMMEYLENRGAIEVKQE